MKIAFFVSGLIRTLYNNFDKNIETIKKKFPNCEVDIYYSFWEDTQRNFGINDEWHSIVENYSLEETPSDDKINKYLKQCGYNEVFGHIESSDVMQSIIDKSPIKFKVLSCQYYILNRLLEKYFQTGYDLYVRIRPDMIINDFISDFEYQSIKDTNSLVLNKITWRGLEYNGITCNEMIWIGTEKSFKKSCEIFLKQEDLSMQVPTDFHYSEYLVSTYFNNLLKSNEIEKITTFNFDYRILR